MNKILLSLFCALSLLQGAAQAANSQLDQLDASAGSTATCPAGAGGAGTVCASFQGLFAFRDKMRETYAPLYVMGRLMNDYKRAHGIEVVDYSGRQPRS